MSKIKLCKTCQKEIAKSAKICPHCGARNKKSKLKLIAISVVILVILVIALSTNSSNTQSTNYINVVKTGYLGNYKSVSIETVFNKIFPNCKWTSFESDDNKEIVELNAKDNTNTPIKIQFSVEKDNTFNVIFIEDNNRTLKDAYSSKILLDTIYDEYSKKFDSSIVCDSSTSNDTLSGTPNNKYKK